MLTIEKSTNELVLSEDDRDANICFAAYLAHSPIRSRKGFFSGDVINESDSAKVLQGIAKISLERSDFIYRGLSQPEADYIIEELAGSVDEFIDEVLR